MNVNDKSDFVILIFALDQNALFSFQVQRGSLVTGKCQGSTTTLLVLETSGSWRRADFYWKAALTMVGTILKTCTWLLQTIHTDSSLRWRDHLLCLFSLYHLQAALLNWGKALKSIIHSHNFLLNVIKINLIVV